ncbi:hypothetical protein PIB30_105194 [Stylosanthes scabra]|uniref:Retrotransposon gag domain-containing protein n=1 Tax=Stylosanthes scabra TaxID=79078 RepID=A0ABU6ZX19_9FABA|nr:hypothetical protein [Stylosanthes scabra]
MWNDGIDRTEMPTCGRGRNTASTSSGFEPNAIEIPAAINTMAATMRDTAAATNRAVDQMNLNGNPNNNVPEDESDGRNGRPITLATFLKVKPPEFKGTVNVTEEKPNTGGQESVVFCNGTMLGTMSVDEYARKFEDLCHFSRVCQGAPEQFAE